ncbi:hypothetical protein ACIQWR_38125 [Streptomyces sp. NPDC098789]
MGDAPARADDVRGGRGRATLEAVPGPRRPGANDLALALVAAHLQEG